MEKFLRPAAVRAQAPWPLSWIYSQTHGMPSRLPLRVTSHAGLSLACTRSNDTGSATRPGGAAGELVSAALPHEGGGLLHPDATSSSFPHNDALVKISGVLGADGSASTSTQWYTPRTHVALGVAGRPGMSGMPMGAGAGRPGASGARLKRSVGQRGVAGRKKRRDEKNLDDRPDFLSETHSVWGDGDSVKRPVLGE